MVGYFGKLKLRGMLVLIDKRLLSQCCLTSFTFLSFLVNLSSGDKLMKFSYN